MTGEYDVLIVGAGSAGLPAAIRAADRGARVLQIEADSRIGGTMHWSTGQISAAGTRQQKQLGIEDSPDAHYEEAQRIANGRIDPVTLRLFVDNAGATIDWLMDHGFEPAPGTPVVGDAHEAYGTRRYLWGTDKAISILDVLRPLHEAHVAEGRIDLRLEHRMTRLLTDGAGSVTGIAAENDRGEETFFGKNIVLASGGYISHPELWEELSPGIPLCSHGNPYSRGDGIRAAQDLDAVIDGSDKFLCTFAGYQDDPDDPTSGQFLVLAPKARAVWEIFVDDNGRRFMQEDHPSIDYRERKLLAQPGMRMNIIYDQGIRDNADPLTLLSREEEDSRFDGNHQNFLKADSLEELAQQLDVPTAALQQTVDAFNQAVDDKNDPAFGRLFMVRKIEKPPFYAIRAMGITVLSPAGLKHDEQLRIIRSDGVPIPNLYSAGEIFGFGRTSGDAFVGGLSLTPALTFGRMLGERLLSW